MVETSRFLRENRGSLARFVVLVAVAVAAYAYVHRPVETAIAWGDDLPAAQERARDRGSAVLIDFTTTGCIYCIKMDREVFSRADVAEAVGQFEPVRLYWSKAEDVGLRYGVQSFPTFLVVKPDGTSVIGVEGFMPAEHFKQFLRRASQLVSRDGPPAAVGPPVEP